VINERRLKMEIIDEYFEDKLPEINEKDKIAQQFYKDFTEEFPRKDIMTISMEQFLYAPKGFGYEKSFCCQLRYSPLASMGNVYPSTFGIYLKGGTQLKLSPTYDGFKTNYENAFDEIKRDIVNLLDAANRLDFDEIERSKLNNAFKGILVAVYFPDKFMPAPTSTALDAYCEAIGYSFPTDVSMLYRNHALVEWKNNIPDFEEWDSYMLMEFCDWLWHIKKTKIDCRELVQNHLVERAKQISDEIDSLHLEGETKNAIVKVRVNQGEFRERLFHRYNKCCLCGVSESSFLIASHIKPWSVSNPIEKLDINNGFLMCPNHDKLFDQGYISFSDSGDIMISSHMRDVDKIFMNVNDNMKIEIAEKNKAYLAYHRDNIYLS
jgi:hypothetical protein